MKLIVNTVGTSLLSNAKRLSLESDTQILEYLNREPRAASAETNALNRLLQNRDQAVLLYSHTSEGKRCAELIQTHIERTHRCEIEEVQGLSYAEKGFVQHGLKNFVQALAKHIRKAKRAGMEPVINATGGFKAEIAYATAVGLVFKTPVKYIHEKFGDIVTLPVTPFGWDSSIFALNKTFFDWIEDQPRSIRDVHSRVTRLVDQEAVSMLLEASNDGTTMLSPLGEAYLSAFQYEEENSRIDLWLSKKAKRRWDSFDAATRTAYGNVLNGVRLANRFSRSELKSGGGDALGYPTGHTDERIFYAFDKQLDNEALYIFEFTRHGREYDQLCSRGLRWLEYPRDEFTRLEL
jgi:putative CRISPR-associated protein (TIGR02619 family)